MTKHFLTIAFGALAAIASAQTITTRTVDTGSGATTGQYISHATISGCPAVTYSEIKVVPFGSSPNVMSILLARNSAADGTGTWNTSTVFRSNYIRSASLPSSLLEIEGKPAVAYHGDGGLWLAKNSTTDGSGTWAYTRISTTGSTGPLATAIIDGNPAVVFREVEVLKIARCTTSSGTGAWQVIQIDAAENVIYGSISLTMVDGKPAVAYRADTGSVFMGDHYDFTDTHLRFARCATADGMGAWAITDVYQTPYVSTDTYFQNSLAVIDGKPSIAFYHNGDLKYTRSGSNDGSGVWTTTVIETAGTTGSYPTLLTISGLPTISYHKSTGSDLRMTRCDTADGTGTWTPVGVDTTGLVGTFAHMTVVAGNPAIAYFDATNVGVKWTRNSQPDASGAWTSATVDDGSDSGVVGTNANLVAIDGNPAVSYYDQLGAEIGRNKYARATTPSGIGGSWAITAPSALNSSGYTVYPLGNRPAFPHANSGSSLLVNSLADGTGPWTFVVLDPGATGTSFGNLAMVGGLPTVVYSSNPLSTLRLARNSLADGSGSWTSTTLTGMQTAGTLILTENLSNPALVHQNWNYNLVFRRSPSADGSGIWSESTIANYGVPTDALTLDGFPAVIFYRPEADQQYHTFLAVNSAADGSGTWTETHLFLGTGDFAYVGGHPAFSIIDPAQQSLRLLRSSTPSFNGPWETWIVDASNACSGPSMATLGTDTAGIAYYNATDRSLKYAHLDFSAPTLSALRIELDGTIITTGQYLVNFGDVKIHGSAATHALTLRNVGTSDLTIGSISLTGSDLPLFSQTGSPLTIAAGNSTTITLGYTPDSTASAIHQASLNLTTSDPVLSSVSISLIGHPLALDALESWRFTHFGTSLDEGNAAVGANPDNDNFDNFFEFATGTDPNSPNLYSPTLELVGGNMEFTYTRSKEAVDYGVSFNVPWSETLISTEDLWDWNYDDTVQTVISETTTTQTVKAVVPMGTAGKRFLRLEPW